jgi:UV excision repair protein RAD23
VVKVQVESEDTVLVVKGKIEAANSELVADRLKLILEGKILNDTQTVSELNVTESTYFVVMVTKEAKAKPAPAAAAPAPAAPVPPAAAPAAAPAAPPAAPAEASPAPQQSYDTPDAVANLMAIGIYAEADIRAALNAAQGNVEVAFHYLENGIPDVPVARASPAAAPSAVSAPAPGGSGVAEIEAFRQHPQFNLLRQTVQRDPGSLSQILQAIGSQQPGLLEAIMANEAAFLAMMNEPIPASAAQAAAPAASAAPAGPPGGGNPVQLLQHLATLPPDQRAAFAAQVGINPDQLQQLMAMITQVPPEQLAAILGGAGGMGGGGGPPPGAIALTPDEMAAVTRLQDLGGGRFSQMQAAQAYLSCDRNEQLAAQLLLDGGFGDDDEDDYDPAAFN